MLKELMMTMVDKGEAFENIFIIKLIANLYNARTFQRDNPVNILK